MVFECRVHSTPPLQVHWYREYDQILDSADFRTLRKSRCCCSSWCTDIVLGQGQDRNESCYITQEMFIGAEFAVSDDPKPQDAAAQPALPLALPEWVGHSRGRFQAVGYQ